jgi:hypothetical protein
MNDQRSDAEWEASRIIGTNHRDGLLDHKGLETGIVTAIRDARREGAHAAFLWLLDILAQGTASPEQATKAIERIRETVEQIEAGEPVRLGEEEL